MIGRKKEIEELNDLYKSQKAELVAVYGRRRVGKTYLVDQVFKGKFGISGISTTQSAWSRREDGEEGAQIDLIIDRSDNELLSLRLVSQRSQAFCFIVPVDYGEDGRLQSQVMQVDGGKWLLLNPWNLTMKLDKNLIRIIKGKST